MLTLVGQDMSRPAVFSAGEILALSTLSLPHPPQIGVSFVGLKIVNMHFNGFMLPDKLLKEEAELFNQEIQKKKKEKEKGPRTENPHLSNLYIHI